MERPAGRSPRGGTLRLLPSIFGRIFTAGQHIENGSNYNDYCAIKGVRGYCSTNMRPLPGEFGTCKTVRSGMRSWFSGKEPSAFKLFPFRSAAADKIGARSEFWKGFLAQLPGKGNSNSHGARPVRLIITMIKWIRTSTFSIKKSLSAQPHSRTRSEQG